MSVLAIEEVINRRSSGVGVGTVNTLKRLTSDASSRPRPLAVAIQKM